MLERARITAAGGARPHASAAAPGAIAVALVLALSSLLARGQAPLLAPLSGPGDKPPAPWTVYTLPRQTKPVTQFTIASIDGRRALRIDANESYGSLGHSLPPDSPPGHLLAWRWRIDQPIPKADLRERSGDDTAVKVCALFDEPLDKLPTLDRVWMKATHAATGAEMPTASVCYVWDSHLAAGTVLPNAFTNRVRYIVLRSGDVPPSTWEEEKRNLDADFLRLFGEEVDVVPRLVGIMIGGDADNTHSHSLAWVADLTLAP